MAERADKSPAPGDDKLPSQESSHDVEQPHPANVYVPDEDYPIERVEAVYRKIDLRIIPGWLHTHTHSLTPPST